MSKTYYTESFHDGFSQARWGKNHHDNEQDPFRENEILNSDIVPEDMFFDLDVPQMQDQRIRTPVDLITTQVDDTESMYPGRSGDDLYNQKSTVNAIGLNESVGIVELPTDGRYRFANEHLQIDLRIDLMGSNIISGDISAVHAGHSEYLASFRSRPGLPLTNEINPLPVVIEDLENRRAQGRLIIKETQSDQITMALSVDAKIKALPIARPVFFIGSFLASSMREIGIELEAEEGVETTPDWDYEGRLVTIESVLEESGFDVYNVGQRDLIPTPASGNWDDSQLHGLMSSFAQEPLNRLNWHVHLLMLQKPRVSGLNGIMFDFGNADLNNLPRQGVAIFQHEIMFPIDRLGNRSETPRADWKRKLIQTTVHEIGHALNLRHRFERALGRANSTSFMNYDWRFLGGGNAEKYWREFGFSFDSDELAFLRHGPRNNVIPGGDEFGSIPYWENTDGGYSPYLPEVITDDLSLNLIPPGSGNLFGFGQPVLLTVELINKTRRSLNLSKQLLDPKTGFLSFIIKRQNNTGINGSQSQSFSFNPIVHRCLNMDSMASASLEPDGKLANNVNLTFGSAGFTFIEPGNYEITAVFALPVQQRDFVVKSNKLTIRVGYPKSIAEEKDGLMLFRDDVGLYMMLGGSDLLIEAEESLNEVVERRQYRKRSITDPLVVSIMRCKAINQTRDFITYENGIFKTRNPRVEKALDIASQIHKKMEQVFDPQTKMEMEDLVIKLQNRKQKKSDSE